VKNQMFHLARCLCVLFTFVSLALEAASSEPSIPDRPEKLKFPPLTYEPPDPALYRLVLKCGPVAYVVPDRELPLINIVIFVRTGDYVEPAGKEGLAGTSGWYHPALVELGRTRGDLLAGDAASGIADELMGIGEFVVHSLLLPLVQRPF